MPIGQLDPRWPHEVEARWPHEVEALLGTSIRDGLVRSRPPLVDIAEVFSPPRVTEVAKMYGLTAGDAMDLTTGWDFDLQTHRDRAMERVKAKRPKLIIGSPECTMYSSLQNLTPWSQAKEQKMRKARRHLEFVCELYREQLRAGWWFLHEHPAAASSWKEQCILGMMRNPHVSTVVGDQCRFGLRNTSGDGASWARKRTRFMSNAPEILRELGGLCRGGHVHTPLLNGSAKAAARYPPDLCRAICRGYIKQMRNREEGVKSLMQVSATDTTDEVPEHEEDHVDMGFAWDDVNNKALNPKMVRDARREEMKYI